MRILHITDRLSARGGADWHLLGVLSRQARRHDARLIVGRDDGTAHAPCDMLVLPQMIDGRDDSTGRQVRSALDETARSFRPDVVHVHNCLNPSVLEWAAERGAVMTVQDHRTFCPGSGKLTLAGAECRRPMDRPTCASCFTDQGYFDRIYATTSGRLELLSRMPRIIVLSRYMKSELVQLGLDDARIAVIPPFVHGLEPAANPTGPPCVLFVGRLVEAKGIFEALEAHRRSGVTLPLVFAGTGSARERLEAAGCDVLGWVPHGELSGVYRRARALLMPCRWQEPFGIVGLEALTMGVPVVAWDSGGVREWLDPGHPAAPLPPMPVTPWGDIDALAGSLRRAVETRAVAPAGFEPATLMAKLHRMYADVSRSPG